MMMSAPVADPPLGLPGYRQRWMKIFATHFDNHCLKRHGGGKTALRQRQQAQEYGAKSTALSVANRRKVDGDGVAARSWDLHERTGDMPLKAHRHPHPAIERSSGRALFIIAL